MGRRYQRLSDGAASLISFTLKILLVRALARHDRITRTKGVYAPGKIKYVGKYDETREQARLPCDSRISVLCEIFPREMSGQRGMVGSIDVLGDA